MHRKPVNTELRDLRRPKFLTTFGPVLGSIAWPRIFQSLLDQFRGESLFSKSELISDQVPGIRSPARATIKHAY